MPSAVGRVDVEDSIYPKLVGGEFHHRVPSAEADEGRLRERLALTLIALLSLLSKTPTPVAVAFLFLIHGATS